MPTTIDYAKYANMNKRTIFNHLLKAEAKLTNLEENFKEKISEQKELIKFLKAQTTKKINERQNSIPSLDEAIKEIENADVIECENFSEYQAKMRE